MNNQNLFTFESDPEDIKHRLFGMVNRISNVSDFDDNNLYPRCGTSYTIKLSGNRRLKQIEKARNIRFPNRVDISYRIVRRNIRDNKQYKALLKKGLNISEYDFTVRKLSYRLRKFMVGSLVGKK